MPCGQKRRSAGITCKVESPASFRSRGTSGSWSNPPATTVWCSLRRSRANANYKGTAFGGSQFCIAVLAGWAWATRYLAAQHIAADAVIQESTIRYLAPVQGALRASLRTPPVEHVERFRKMLLKAGRGRIRLHVDIHYERSVATQFDGTFVAAVRPQPAAAS